MPTAKSTRPDSLAGAMDRLAEAAGSVDVTGSGPLLATALRRLRAAGVHLTDRRAIRVQRLIAAAAVLDGRLVASPGDLWVLPLIVPTADTQATATSVLSDLIADATNRDRAARRRDLLPGPRSARGAAGRGCGRTAGLLDGRMSADERIRVEALLREIDASVASEERPEGPETARSALVARLGGEATASRRHEPAASSPGPAGASPGTRRGAGNGCGCPPTRRRGAAVVARVGCCGWLSADSFLVRWRRRGSAVGRRRRLSRP